MTARKSYEDLDPLLIWQIGQSEYTQAYLARRLRLSIATIRMIQADQRRLHDKDTRYAPARVAVIHGMSEAMRYAKSRPHGQRPAGRKPRP